CGVLEYATDALLFRRILRRGERSPLFGSRSRVLNEYRDVENRVRFFYLNTGDEIARVEVPAWVGDSPSLLDQVHALVTDQIRKGDGYPRALSEAHEQAVVRGPD